MTISSYGKPVFSPWFLLIFLTLFAIFLAACEQKPGPTPTPTATPTEGRVTPSPTPTPTATATPPRIPPPTPTPTPSPAVTPLHTPTPTPTPSPTPTPTPTATPQTLPLELLSPKDGAGVEIGAVRVQGKTRADAIVAINGVPVEVTINGGFQRDALLQAGTNTIEVVATDISGRTAVKQLAVFFISTTSGLPFTVFYPSDGLQIKEPTIQVIGGTRPDAVVGVNGTPVGINALGLFSANVTLQPGANIIEAVATDIHGNVRFQTLVVFYTP